MYSLDLDTCTGIDVIQRSMTCHPSLFAQTLLTELEKDLAYSRGKGGATKRAIDARIAAIRSALANAGDASFYLDHLGPGIIALNIACNLQLIPRHVRTALVVRTWPE